MPAIFGAPSNVARRAPMGWWVALLLSSLVMASAASADDDHLKCFKVRDQLRHTLYTGDLSGLVPQDGCTITLPAEFACIPSDKTNLSPTPPGGGGGGPTNGFACYKVRCPRVALPPVVLDDQFGTRVGTPTITKMICAPLAPAGGPTTTTTPGSTTTTTTTPASTTTTGATATTTTTTVTTAPTSTVTTTSTTTPVPSTTTTTLCPAGDIVCSSACVDPSTDLSNCGSCGHVCAAGASCVGGLCTCPAGTTLCGAACVDTQTDPNNCGGCGQVCTISNGTPGCASGQCTVASCNAGFGDCNNSPVDGCESSLTSVTGCGACGNVCPGYLKPDDNVTCNVSQACTFTCQSEHYDVDNNPSDGCEVVDSPTANHTQNTATSAGSIDCNDGNGMTVDLTGGLPSDKRVHENPAVSGFDSATGSAPDFFSISATGGFTCQDDVVLTLTVTGSASPTCYKLTVITDKVTLSCQTGVAGTCSINQTSNQYSDGTTILVDVSKTCGTNVTENVPYSVVGHL
jgi:hypothetical protein